MDGIPALDLWDLVIEGLHSSSNQPKKSKENVQGNLLHDTPSRKHTKNQGKTQLNITHHSAVQEQDHIRKEVVQKSICDDVSTSTRRLVRESQSGTRDGILSQLLTKSHNSKLILQ